MAKRWRRVGNVCGVGLLLLLVLVAATPALARHGGSGSRLLTWTYQGSGSQATFRNVVTAPDGAVYAVGATESNGADAADVLAVRFGAGPTPEWTRTWDNGVRGAYAWSAAVDRGSNLIVVGMTATQAAGDDWVVLKYSPAGDLLWSATLGGAYPSSDYVNAVACDRAGNVYAAGGLLDAADNHCFAVAKFAAADGQLLWKYVEDGLDPSWHDDTSNDVVVDGGGSVYATGVSYNADHSLRRCLTVKLSPAAGHPAWRRVIRARGLNRYGYYLSLAGTSLYVQMYGDQPGDTNPLTLAKYTTGGTRSWLRYMPLKGASTVYPYAMTANRTGAAVAADAGEGGGLVAKFTPAGKLAWAHVYRRSATRVSRSFHAVCMDAQGRVWAAGQAVSPGPASQGDWLIQRFSATGVPVWAKTLGGIAGGWEGAEGAALAGTSALWVVGNVADTADGGVTSPTVAKYRR